MNTDISMSSDEMQLYAANGGENSMNGDVALSTPAVVYNWDDQAFKASPKDMAFFRAARNIVHDLGNAGKLTPTDTAMLIQLGAVRSVTESGKPYARVQTNHDNPTNVTGYAHGWYVPPRKDALSTGGADGEIETAGYSAVGDDGDDAKTETLLESQDTAELETGCDALSTASSFFEQYMPSLESLKRLDSAVKPAYLSGGGSPELAAALRRVYSFGCCETLITAVSYAATGWRVLPWKLGYYGKGADGQSRFEPLRDGDTPPNGEKVSKKPIIKGWVDNATTDTNQLSLWFDDGEFSGKPCCGRFEGSNVGIATGATSAGYELLVVDVDIKNGKNGLAALGGVCAEYGALPKTLAALTPSGGFHFLFKVPDGSGIGSRADVFKKFGEGLDIRCNGGFIGAAPSTVNGKPYRWLNDALPAWLPDGWVEALRVGYSAGGKGGALSRASNGEGDRAKATGRELLDMPEDVVAALKEHAVPSSVGRTDWLKVLSVLSAFKGGEETAREWSRTGSYSDRFSDVEFDKGWDEVHSGFGDGVAMGVGVLFGMVKARSPEWKTPEARSKQAAAEAVEAEGKARLDAARAAVLGEMPAWMKAASDARVQPMETVGDTGAARHVFNEFVAKGSAVMERVVRGEDVGHDIEFAYIAGMLTMDAVAVKAHVELNPAPGRRGSGFLTANGTVRAVIAHDDGSKPHTVEEVDMNRFVPDYVGGTSDLVTRLASVMLVERNALAGEKPTPTEKALVHKLLEVSPLGHHWVDDAAAISAQHNGWNLKGAIDNGLTRAQRYDTGGALSTASRRGRESTQQGGGGDHQHKRSAEQLIMDAVAGSEWASTVAFDGKYNLFYTKKGHIWEAQPSHHNISRVLERLADTDGLAYTSRTIEGATKLLAMRLDPIEWCVDRNLVPMANGVLDVKRKVMLDYNACLSFNWQLPYTYEPAATCPVFHAFMRTSLEGDSDAVSVIQAFLHCVFVGDNSAERFIEITGSGGTGKTTLMNVVTKLVGANNTQSTTFGRLEENRYETAALYGARLIVIPDAKKYAGDMETFKKLTGRDKLPYEEKHVQRQRGTDFTSDALVMVTGNGDIKASDTSSGVLRRRLKVKFNRIVPDAEKTQYGVGGIGAVLEAEMPGIVNWALSIGTETALGMLRNPGKRMQALAEETARNNDPVLEWLTTSCVQCKPDEETPIGRLAGSSTASIPAIGLYPNFVDYCEGAGIHKIPSVATFTHNILDHCNRHGIHAEHKKVVARSSALRQKRIIVGVRLRTSDDEAADSDDACRGFFGDAL